MLLFAKQPGIAVSMAIFAYRFKILHRIKKRKQRPLSFTRAHSFLIQPDWSWNQIIENYYKGGVANDNAAIARIESLTMRRQRYILH